MSVYIDRDKLCDFARIHKDGAIDCNDIMRFPTTEIEELAPRYIDANTAIKSFKDSHIEGNCYTPNFIVEFFEKQPTADVEEVRHAKWIYKGHNDMTGHVFQCSVCGRWRFANSTEYVIEEYPYCHCGARIDLED